MAANVLVTGGAGFIGSHVVHRLAEAGYDVRVFDNLETGYEKNLVDVDVEFVRGDVEDPAQVEDAVEGVDGVFHLAAHVGNRKSIENPVRDAETNVVGTVNVLEAARKHDVSNVVFSSSAAIFGEVEYTPVDESHPVEPDSPYGVTKLASEKHCLCYARLYDIDVACLRYFNVYGTNQRYDVYGNVIPIWTHRLLDGESLVVYGDGEQTRDFVNVEDVARANVSAFEADASGAFNVGTGEATSINELASVIDRVTDREVTLEYADPRKGEVKHSVATIEKARDAFDYEPKVGLEDGLREYLQWMETRQTDG